MNDQQINEMVMLLAISKMQNDETLKDIIFQMENAGALTLKESKKLIKDLKAKNLIIDDKLSFVGIQKAKEAEQFFKV
jgi:hypothetical protein